MPETCFCGIETNRADSLCAEADCPFKGRRRPKDAEDAGAETDEDAA